MPKEYVEPDELPPDATPAEREKHRKDSEKFLTEGFRKGASQVPAKVDPTDPRLARLRKEAGAFMELHSPMKASLWLALTRPVADLISDVEQTRRFAAAQRGTGVGLAHKPPRHSAIIEIGQRLVTAAMDGDMSALNIIADRIEGKPGLRKGDEDPNDAQHRAASQELIGRITKLMTAQAIAIKPKDDQIVDVEVVEVKNEVPEER